MEYPPPGEGHHDLGPYGEVLGGGWRGRPVGPALASPGRGRGGRDAGQGGRALHHRRHHDGVSGHLRGGAGLEEEEGEEQL